MELSTIEDADLESPSSSWQNKKSNPPKDPKVDYCGIGPWRPACLEPLRDIRAFIAAMCFVSCVQASYSGYTSSQITTIEKRFAIGSIIVGVVSSFFEIGYISCVMIVSYFGSKGRVPLWISLGLFVMSLGAFLFQTPQFLFPYDNSFSHGKNIQLCSMGPNKNITTTPQKCNAEVGGTYHFLPLLLLAQFLIGAGSSPILTLAPPFIDDHVPPTKAPGMIASIYAAAALGPVFGYALGAFMLQHPMDMWSTNKILHPDLNPTSADWIGAWWAGYIILGCGVFLGACILMMFPRTLRSSFTHRKSSLENVKPAPDATISEPVADSNMHNVNPKAPPPPVVPVSIKTNEGPTMPSIDVRSQLYSRASYQHHQRSFSGNVTSGAPPPPISAGVASHQQVFFPATRYRHQRSASVGSVLLHAAIVAATASHAEEVVEDDDALPSTDTEASESSCSSVCRHSIEDEKKQKQRNSPVRQSSFFPSPFNRSMSLTRTRWRKNTLTPTDFRHHQQQQRWTPPPWATDSSESSTSSTIRARSPRTRAGHHHHRHSGLPAPALDAMAEDSNSEAPSTPIKQLSSTDTPLESRDLNNNTTPNRKSHRSSDDQTAPSKGLESPSAVVVPSIPPLLPPATTTATAVAPTPSRPSILMHLHRHRKHRRRKVIRGRIFGFLADWSKDIPKSIYALLKNKIYTVACLCICSEMFIVIGFAGFLPKYLEIEYQISKAKASMIAGILIVPSGALGILAGGLILNKARFNRKSAVIFVFCVNFVIMSCMSSFFFLGCENPRIAGITVPYPVGRLGGGDVVDNIRFNTASLQNQEIARPESTPCCAACGCNPNVWNPVCHPETSTIFFSPCFAGCTQGPSLLPGTLQTYFHHCECLRSFATPPNETNYVPLRTKYTPSDMNTMGPLFSDELLEGVCAPGCKTLIPFICFLTVLLFLTGVIQNPLLMVTMRSVGHSERSLALGLQFVIIKLLANMPSPIVFGRAIDGACVLWRTDDCGRLGDCAFMDLKQLTNYITGLGITVKGLGIFIYTLLIYLLSSHRHSSGGPSSREVSRTLEDPNDNVDNNSISAADAATVPLRPSNTQLQHHSYHRPASGTLS